MLEGRGLKARDAVPGAHPHARQRTPRQPTPLWLLTRMKVHRARSRCWYVHCSAAAGRRHRRTAAGVVRPANRALPPTMPCSCCPQVTQHVHIRMSALPCSGVAAGQLPARRGAWSPRAPRPPRRAPRTCCTGERQGIEELVSRWMRQTGLQLPAGGGAEHADAPLKPQPGRMRGAASLRMTRIACEHGTVVARV